MSCRKINYTDEALRTALTANILRILVRWLTSTIVFRFPLCDHSLQLPTPDMSLPIHILSVTSVFHQTYASKFKSGDSVELRTRVIRVGIAVEVIGPGRESLG